MNVALIGAEGNMGKRYHAILRYFGHTVFLVDLPRYEHAFQDAIRVCDHVIIATPTDTHFSAVNDVLSARYSPCSILCEKPVVKEPAKLDLLYHSVESHGSKLYCVNQYNYLPEAAIFGQLDNEPSTYDYFHSGKDGLLWDCFQVFALSYGDVFCYNKSPVWKCYINQVPINIRNMDRAYVDMIYDFLGDKRHLWSRDIVFKTTEKILSRT